MVYITQPIAVWNIYTMVEWVIIRWHNGLSIYGQTFAGLYIKLILRSLLQWNFTHHYNDVIMSAMTSQITFCSGTDEIKHQSSASLAFVRGIHRWLVNSPHKGTVMRKMFPFDDVIMKCKIKNITKMHLTKWFATYRTFCSGFHMMNMPLGSNDDWWIWGLLT